MVILYILGWTFVGCGVAAVGGAALNLDLFMNSPQVQPYVNTYGRTAARLIYVVLGLVLTGVGGLIVFGLWAAGN